MTRPQHGTHRYTLVQLLLAGALAIGLAACTGVESTSQNGRAEQAPDTPQLTAIAGETLLAIDRDASVVRIYTYRGGKLAKFGHNHVITAVPAGGRVAARPGLSGSRFEFSIDLDEMVVDDAAERAAAGPEFSSRPSPDDIAATRTNMLGADGLDADRFPRARIVGEVVAATRNGAKQQVNLRLNATVHGKTLTLNVPAEVVRTSRGLRIQGRTRLSQQAFGITPFSVLLGALTVLDDVDVSFDLLARPEES
ncbi:MAG: YceI family protein [Pseudomonadota bacterium]